MHIAAVADLSQWYTRGCGVLRAGGGALARGAELLSALAALLGGHRRSRTLPWQAEPIFEDRAGPHWARLMEIPEVGAPPRVRRFKYPIPATAPCRSGGGKGHRIAVAGRGDFPLKGGGKGKKRD